MKFTGLTWEGCFFFLAGGYSNSEFKRNERLKKQHEGLNQIVFFWEYIPTFKVERERGQRSRGPDIQELS